jgi:hemolysin activation/secretion protein
VSGYDYRQTVQGVNERFVTTGNTRQYELRTQRLVHRSARSKTSVTFNVSAKRSHNYLEDVEITSQRRVITIAQPGITHRRYLGNATLDVALSLKQGVGWLGAQDDPQQQNPDAPTSRFRIYVLDIGLTQPLFSEVWPLRYQSSVRTQYSSDRLFNSEFFAIGNRYTVRGFDGEQTLSAERGVLWRNELVLSWPRFGQEYYAALDYGRVGGISSPQQDRTLTGGALGLRGRWSGLQYEASAGWPLHRPSALTVRQPAYVVQASYSY